MVVVTVHWDDVGALEICLAAPVISVLGADVIVSQRRAQRVRIANLCPDRADRILGVLTVDETQSKSSDNQNVEETEERVQKSTKTEQEVQMQFHRRRHLQGC